jgi:hypothetical protein
LGGEAPLAKIVAHILLSHHLPDNPNEQNQIDAEYFSQDNNQHVDLLNFACFVRKNYTRENEMEEATIKLLAQVVSRGVDIWKEADNEATSTEANDSGVAKLRDHFCNCYLPLASNSHFVEAGVKEARIVSTTGRNEELRSVYAICRSCLFGKLKPSTNTPPRVHQILTVIIHQNSEHQNEVTKLERIERRKQVTSALLENHFRKDRLEKKQKNISKKGSEDKADNVTQRLEGVEDTAFIDGKTQYGKLWMKEHTDDLNDELTFRGLEEFLFLAGKRR